MKTSPQKRAHTKTASQTKVKQKPPFPFVLEALAPLQPEVRRMFSGFAVYVGDLLVCMLLDHVKHPKDNGVWVVLAEGVDPQDKSLRRDFPSLRKIAMLGGVIGHWLVIPLDGKNFEGEAERFCELLVRRDPRLGRVPKSRQ
jgi:hypothetical protein